jgi:CelD/BcsL family acetyltransferase involved in cellulose biosynthesis
MNHVVEITTVDELERLRAEWIHLWSRCSDATPFQSPHWLIPWYRHLNPGALWVVALRDRERLSALAPFFIGEGDRGERCLSLAGTGVSDYLDVLFSPGSVMPAETLFRFLDSRHSFWDTCDFRQLRACSLLLHPLSSWREQVAADEPCPVLELDPTPSAGSSRLDKNLRYCAARAEKLGEFVIEPAAEQNLEAWLRALFELHGLRWRRRGEPGVLCDQNVRAFHAEVARFAAQAKILRGYVVRLNGEIAAAYYGFADRARAYYYLGGFNPRYAALSPGLLAIRHAISEAAAEGKKEFDFLRGQEAYKYRFGARDRPCYRRRINRD